MNICPHCQRRLLSRASVRCNWCGETIEDTAYQTNAQAERDVFFAHQALRDAESLARVGQINVNAFDPLADPFIGNVWPRQDSLRIAAGRRTVREEAAFQERLAWERRLAADSLPPSVAATAENCENEPQEQPDITDEKARFQHLEL